jgi:Flp pilus assembly pilin Flp
VRESFWRCEKGQDLVEYSLLLAFICLAGAAAFIGMNSATSSIWGVVNSRLAASNQTSS